MLDVTVFNWFGKVLPANAVATDYGLKVTLPEVLYVDSFPSGGDFYTIQVQLAASAWNDTTKFPCRESLYEPLLPACDYYLHGWQTADGYPRTQLADSGGACASEGVSGCVAAAASAWRVTQNEALVVWRLPRTQAFWCPAAAPRAWCSSAASASRARATRACRTRRSASSSWATAPRAATRCSSS